MIFASLEWNSQRTAFLWSGTELEMGTVVCTDPQVCAVGKKAFMVLSWKNLRPGGEEPEESIGSEIAHWICVVWQVGRRRGFLKSPSGWKSCIAAMPYFERKTGWRKVVLGNVLSSACPDVLVTLSRDRWQGPFCTPTGDMIVTSFIFFWPGWWAWKVPVPSFRQYAEETDTMVMYAEKTVSSLCFRTT